MSQMDTVEHGQYWMWDGKNVPSLWLVDAVQPDDRGEGLWVTIVLVCVAGYSHLGFMEVGSGYNVPIEDFDSSKWSQVDEEDVPLYILGEVG